MKYIWIERVVPNKSLVVAAAANGKWLGRCHYEPEKAIVELLAQQRSEKVVGYDFAWAGEITNMPSVNYVVREATAEEKQQWIDHQADQWGDELGFNVPTAEWGNVIMRMLTMADVTHAPSLSEIQPVLNDLIARLKKFEPLTLAESTLTEST